MGEVRRRAEKLARIASRLQAQSGRRGLPALWFLTDEARTPDPLRVAAELPAGAAVLLRHYRDPARARLAAELCRIARARSLRLFIAADPELARAVGAAGLHLPSWALAPAFRPWPDFLVTASVHDCEELRRRRLVCDGFLVSPVFATPSHAGMPWLGPLRLAALVRAAGVPVIALGGVTGRNAGRLLGTGVAGLAAIGALTGEDA
jgi:thiamine-phosphate pyrophosphorylase